jgi:GDP-L-fucose synthase
VQGMDIVIHAAAITSGAKDIVNNPHFHIADTAVMNSLVLRAAFEAGVRHIVVFSCAIIYPTSDKLLSERDFDPGVELYPHYFGAGWGKIYLEKMCEFYARLGRNRFTVLRHSNNYGPYDKFDLEKSHVFGATMTKVMAASDGKITIWGDGNEERDLLYVSDLVRAVELAIERQQADFNLFNIGMGSTVTVNDLVRKVIACSGRELEISYDRSKIGLKARFCLDCAKARESLGWQPKVSLDEGIRKTMDWYKEFVAKCNVKRG